MAASKNAAPRVRLVDDHPVQIDAFRSNESPGPHEQVAEAIVRLISSPDELGGKTIGLEGGWGSGKSTIVRMIRTGLKRAPGFEVVVFDAWAHEGDPLRRTFLEAIVDGFQKLNWVNKCHWDRIKDDISGRKKTQKVKTRSRPTCLGTLLGLSALGLPAGAAFLAAALGNGLTIDFSSRVNYMAILGLFFSFSWAVILFANLVRLLFRWPVSLEHVFKIQNWSVLQGESSKDTITVTLRTPNPTSIEFENYFVDLMKEALSGHDSRHVLLVVDNLDRVDPSDALSIWSTLQTFLQECGYRDADWFSQLWVLVPYDSSGIRKLWDNRQPNKKPVPGELVNDRQGNEDGLSYQVSDTFLDKSFSVRFMVPPPVLSDWKRYLIGLVGEALPDLDAKQSHGLYQVYERCRPNPTEIPTPRQLKIYVNQVGATYRQWWSEFPIGDIAFFVLNCREQHTFIQKLRGDDYPGLSAIDLLGDSLKPNLAGLVFNTTSDKGMELLLAAPIFQSLIDRDGDALNELRAGNDSGFWAVLESVARGRLNGADSEAIANSGSCLSESAILEVGVPESDSVLDALQAASEAVEVWRPFNKEIADGVAAVCQLVNTPDFSEAMAGSVQKTMRSLIEQESAVDVSECINGLVRVIQGFETLGHNASIPSSITTPLTIDEWAEACEILIEIESGSRYWKRIAPNVNAREFSSTLAKVVAEGEFGENHLAMIRVTHMCPLNPRWTLVCNAIVKQMRAGASSEIEQVALLLECLWLLRSIGVEEGAETIKTLVEGGFVAHSLHRASSSDNSECTGLCIAIALSVDSGLPQPEAFGNANVGHQNLKELMSSYEDSVLQAVLELLRRYGELEQLLHWFERAEGGLEFVNHCIRRVAKSDYFEEMFGVDVVLEHWRNIKDALAEGDDGDDGSFEHFLSRLLPDDLSLCSIIDSDAGFDHGQAELYWRILDCTSGSARDFARWCGNGLERMDDEAWYSDLRGPLNCVWLTYELANREHQLKLTTACTDALARHAEFLVDGEDVPAQDIVKVWPEFLGQIDGSLSRALGRSLIDVAVNSAGQIGDAFFTVYGGVIGDPSLLAGTRNVVGGLIEPILRGRREKSLSWLKELLEKDSSLLDAFDDVDGVTALRTRIKDEVNKNEFTPTSLLIREIAKIAGIDAPNEKLAVGEDEHEGADEEDVGEELEESED